MKYEDLHDEYLDLWESCSVTAAFSGAATIMANKIMAGKDRYQEIESKTGVPWYWVGITHAMESGCRFSTHLHNGDPLTRRTRQIPAGRPAKGKPPFTWEESAVDALLMKGLHQVTDWSVPMMLYQWEGYNGWGYRRYHSNVLTPYLWSGSSHYRRGKYTSDGSWDSTEVSGQTGAALLLKKLAEIDGSSVPIYTEGPRVAVKPEPDIVPASFHKAEENRTTAALQKSNTIFGALIALIGMVLSFFEGLLSTLLEAGNQLVEWQSIKGLLTTMGANAKTIGFSLGIAGIALVIVRRIAAARKGKIG